MKSDLGMFCLSLRQDPLRFAKIELIHAPPVVVDCVRSVANEVNGLSEENYSFETPSKDMLGALQFKMSDQLFKNPNTKVPSIIQKYKLKKKSCRHEITSTMGKVFCVRLIEELHKIGYDLQISSDLNRWPYSPRASLFFKKVTSERSKARVVCVAPGREDTIVLLNHSESVKNMVENAIKGAWPSGIQRQEDEEVLGHTVHKIKMNGYPWWIASVDNVDNNRIVNMIVGNLNKINLRLVGGINLKGGIDSLFFIEDPCSHAKFSCISLCDKNWLRLVDCKGVSASIRQAITKSGFRIQDEYFLREHDTMMHLNGSPWQCSGADAVQSRQLVVQISEKMLQQGWVLTDAIDFSQPYPFYPYFSINEKSMLLFRKCVPTNASFSCICLTSRGNLRLINFSPGDKKVLRSCILKNHLPGASVHNTYGAEGNSLKFNLTGNPWSSHGAGLHARSLLVHLFAAAINLGFQIVASADVSSKYKLDPDEQQVVGPLDVHSIYLMK